MNCITRWRVLERRRSVRASLRSADSRASRALRTAGRTRTLTDITRRTGQTGAEQHERTEHRRGRDRRLIGVVADPDRLARGATRIRWDTRGEAAEHRHAADQRNPVLDDVHVVSIPLGGETPFVWVFSPRQRNAEDFARWIDWRV